MRQGRKTTQEERIRIAKECIGSGKNYGEMALKYQVSYQQVRKRKRAAPLKRPVACFM